MKHEEYWKQRFMQLENSQHGMTAAAFAKIEAQYRAAQKEIEGKIALWYQRFADNNNVSMAEARQWLSGNALKELKWDVKDYIKYGKENALLGGAWMQELENASAKFHISKLEALKIHTQQSLEKLFSKQESTIAGLLGDVYKSGYYHTAYELQKGFGIGFDIAAVDQPYLEKVLAKPWAADGKNFSERIWGNKEKIIQEAHTELSHNILTGGDPQKAIDSLSKKFQTSKNNAARLVQTEQAYFSSVAQRECFKDLGVEEYEIVATLDSHTSDICQGLDGQHFPMKDFEAGITAPPFHVNCRSTTAPYFAENFGQIGQRAARDAETGKTYYVPDDLKYADWKAAFVDGGQKKGLKFVPRNDRIKPNIIKGALLVTEIHPVCRLSKELYSVVTSDITTDEVIITDTQIAHIKDRHPKDYELFVKHGAGMIASPDYILAANKPFSAVVLKEVEEGGERLKLILRLKTSVDPADFKNSIITFQSVNAKRFDRYVKNGKILYKAK